MIITVEKRQFEGMLIESAKMPSVNSSKTKKVKLDNTLAVSKVSKTKSKMGKAWMQGLPRCISNEQYSVVMKGMEDKKKQEGKKRKPKSMSKSYKRQQ